MSAIDTLKEAVAGIAADWPIIRKFTGGSATDTIQTDAGTLPVIAKVVADAQAVFEQAKTDLIAQKGGEIDAAGTGLLAQTQAIAGGVQANADTVGTKAAAVTVSAASAATSATAAASARDAALIQAGVYVDEPTGRAAVADGQAFKVQGDGVNVAAYEYRRVNANTASTLLASYPASGSLDSARVSTGELLASLTMQGAAINGAANVVDSAGRYVGFSISAASSGFSSWVTGVAPLSADDLAALTGQTLSLVAVYSASVNFLADKPLNAPSVRVQLAAGGYASRGTAVSKVQNGTTLTIVCAYTVQGDEAAIGNLLQISPGAVANNAHSVQLKSQVFYVQPSAPAKATALTASDLMADFRARLTAIATAAKIATATAPFSTLAQTQSVLGVTSGEQFASLSMAGAAVGGAVALNDALGRYAGFSIDAAQAGASAWVAGLMPVTAADLAAFAGATLYLVAVYTATAGFVADKAPVANIPVRIALSAGGNANRGTHVSTTQNGTTVTRIVAYTVQGDEASIGVMLQVAADAVANRTHSIQLRSQAFYVQAASATASADTPADRMADYRLRRISAAIPTPFRASTGKADFTTSPQLFNGAVARNDSNGVAWGWTIPAGKTGATTLLQCFWKVPGASVANPAVNLTGRVMRFTLGCDTSANYSRNVGIGGQTQPAAGGTRAVATTTLANRQTSATRRQIVFSMPLTGDELVVQPYIRCPDATTTAADEWLLVTDVMVEIVSTTGDTLSVQDENARLFRDLLMQAVAAQIATAVAAFPATTGYAKTLRVRADGTGDFTTLRAAALSIADAGANRRYEIQLYDPHTVITDIAQANWQLPAYVDVRYAGVGYGWIEYHFPANTTPADTVNTSGFWMNFTSKLTGVKVTMQNGRYPVHSDGSGANPDQTIELVDSWFEHFGCQEVIDYQTALGANGNPAAVWRSWSPFGYGSASGQVMSFLRCTLASPDRGGYLHTNQAFSTPSRQRFTMCRLMSRNVDGHAMLIQPLGSGQRDVVELNNCQLQGDVWITTDPWIPVGAYQPSDRCEVVVYLNGCTPVAFNYDDTALALIVSSKDTTAAASVTAQGSGAAALFGTPVVQAGGGGLPARLVGALDVSGVAVGLARNVYVTSMGYRLGNCTAVNKVLTLTFNGGPVVTVTFDQDYTNATNASILAAINTAIQSAFGDNTLVLCTTESVYASERAYVLDQEVYVQNTGAIGLPRGSAVRYDADDVSVVPMGVGDPAGAFLGVTLERVAPGAWARVRRAKGQPFRVSKELARSDAGGFVKGDTFGIGGMPGRFVKGAATPLFVAINANKVTGV